MYVNGHHVKLEIKLIIFPDFNVQLIKHFNFDDYCYLS